MARLPRIDHIAVARQVATKLEDVAIALRGIAALPKKGWVFPFAATGSYAEEFADKLKVALNGINNGIYVIRFTGVTCNEVLESYSKRSDLYVHSKINIARETSTLYVGRSKNVHKRLIDHLIAGPKGRYSLHMGGWATDLPGLLSLEVIDCSTLPDATIQALEDGLWDELCPLLGKRGGR